MRFPLAICVMSILAGCTNTPDAPAASPRSGAWVKPIRPNCDDIVSTETMRQIVIHNRMWALQNGVPLPKTKPDYCAEKSAQDPLT